MKGAAAGPSSTLEYSRTTKFGIGACKRCPLMSQSAMSTALTVPLSTDPRNGANRYKRCQWCSIRSGSSPIKSGRIPGEMARRWETPLRHGLQTPLIRPTSPESGYLDTKDRRPRDRDPEGAVGADSSDRSPGPTDSEKQTYNLPQRLARPC